MKIPHRPGDGPLQRVCSVFCDLFIDVLEAVGERLDPPQPYAGTQPAWVDKAQRRLEERLAGAPPTPAEQEAADSLRARWSSGSDA